MAVAAVARVGRLADLLDVQLNALRWLHGAVEEREVAVVAFQRDGELHTPALPVCCRLSALRGRIGLPVDRLHRLPGTDDGALLPAAPERDLVAGLMEAALRRRQ